MKRMDRIAQGLAAIAAVALASTAVAEDRVLEGDADAKGLVRLRMEAHVGSVDIVAKDGDRIAWKVRLEPDKDDGWFSSRKDAQAAIDGAKVRAVAAGDSWDLELELPRGTDFDDVVEHWTIEVPPRFAVELDANVGEMEVMGVAGGVEAKLNVGDLRIVSRTRSLGRVELEANVGGADLMVDGKRTESSGLFVGGKVRSDNKGDDDVDARVNVGEVRVRVER